MVDGVNLFYTLNTWDLRGTILRRVSDAVFLNTSGNTHSISIVEYTSFEERVMAVKIHLGNLVYYIIFLDRQNALYQTTF